MRLVVVRTGVLYARCDRFRAMLGCGMREAAQEEVILDDPHLTPELFLLLLEYIYCGAVQLEQLTSTVLTQVSQAPPPPPTTSSSSSSSSSSSAPCSDDAASSSTSSSVPPSPPPLVPVHVAVRLFVVADYYMLDGLKATCEMVIGRDVMEEDNVLPLLELAILHHGSALLRYAVDWLADRQDVIEVPPPATSHHQHPARTHARTHGALTRVKMGGGDDTQQQRRHEWHQRLRGLSKDAQKVLRQRGILPRKKKKQLPKPTQQQQHTP